MSFKDNFLKKSPVTSHGGPHTDPTDNYKKLEEAKKRRHDPEAAYKKEMAEKLAEINKLDASLKSQKSAMSKYDQQLAKHNIMAKKLRAWGEYAKKGNIGDYTPEVEQAIKGKIKPHWTLKAALAGDFDSFGFRYTDKDKKQIGITGGDAAGNDMWWRVVDYAPKPEGERPVVDTKLQELLKEKQKAYNLQTQAGFRQKPTKSVIKEQPVYTGPVYDHSTGKVKRYITTAQYRTKE